MALIINRKEGESIQIGPHINITLHKILGRKAVELAVEAPQAYRIIRSELHAPVATSSLGPPDA